MADEDLVMSPQEITEYIRKGDREENTEKKEKIVKSTDKVRISTDKVRINMDKLNAGQEKIVQYILINKKITNKEVQKLLGIKDSRALKILKELVEKNIIVKQGRFKGSYYILKNDEEK